MLHRWVILRDMSYDAPMGHVLIVRLTPRGFSLKVLTGLLKLGQGLFWSPGIDAEPALAITFS